MNAVRQGRGQFAARGEGRSAPSSSALLPAFAKRYACVGDASIGRGPLNAIVDDYGRRPGRAESRSRGEHWSPADGRLDVFGYAKRPRACGRRAWLPRRRTTTRSAATRSGARRDRRVDRRHALDARAAADRLGPADPSGDDYSAGDVGCTSRRGAGRLALAWLERSSPRHSAISAAHLAAAGPARRTRRCTTFSTAICSSMR